MNRNVDREASRRRGGFRVMAGLIGLVRPLFGMMALAVGLGCIGNLMAVFITVLGSVGIGKVLGFFPAVSLPVLFLIIGIFALARGMFRYGEQACNHYIAFKLLAQLRHQVFTVLRKLAPAKLDGREKGNLISIITTDIELLEVFYAHTVSPIAIALVTSLGMVLWMGHFHPVFGGLAAVFYLLVGAVIPVANSRQGQKYGLLYRKVYGKLNTSVLDNLYGMEEILQYGQEKERQEKMNSFTKELESVNRILKNQEALQKIVTDVVILLSGVLMASAGWLLSASGEIGGEEALICVVSMMSSFGPTAALSALSNNLNQTLASGKRMLDLLAEEPVFSEVTQGETVPEGDIHLEQVSFAYPRQEEKRKEVLKNLTLSIRRNTIHGILGESGCGKSTLLKLLMRFYETDRGGIFYGENDINQISTEELRKHTAYVTQETFLFQDTIENNIRIGRAQASRREVEEAARKASIHDWIVSLPEGYDTQLSELGASLSGGERQRIGIARAFLHQADMIFLDEPTSNIDSLNEGMILKSLAEEAGDKTIILVSHRKSTVSIADEVTKLAAI